MVAEDRRGNGVSEVSLRGVIRNASRELRAGPMGDRRAAEVAGRPRLLDFFCGAGGCSVGYARAGFDVIGVDINPQPNYPYELIRMDALAYLRGKIDADRCHLFDAIHASPPCQSFTAYKRTGNVGEYPNLIPETRELLKQTGLPYVIENVEGAPLESPTMLCGSAFGLDVRRHRLFETNFPIMAPGCSHGRQAPNRYPGGRSKERTGTNRGLCRNTVEVGTWDTPLDVQKAAMGIDWMTLEELSEAIPPAYTEHIGGYLMAAIESEVTA